MTNFPAGFLWGAATSAYQIEGSPLADGAGPSNWHVFTHQPGTTPDGENGDIACDHYRRWREDIGLMKELGLQAYRFSLAWARILPEGTGAVNEAGLDFYERLVDGLLEVGIQPTPTIFHWDMPAALDERGGWTNPDMVGWFADYAEVVIRRLGDRVSRWMTINEPWVVTDGGYVHGVHPPGRRDMHAAALAAHHLLCAHGETVRRFRALSDGQIGIAVNLEPKTAVDDDPATLAAVARAHAYMNRQFLDPLFKGSYPAELDAVFGGARPEFPAADFDLIREPIDFLGLNYYTRSVNRADPASIPAGAAPVRREGAEYTEMGWEVHPDSLTDVLVWIRDQYGEVPIYITENGSAFNDPAPEADGRVRDEARCRYLRNHLAAMHEAIAQGVPVKGYFAWSLMDNFEWACGFAKRFGLLRVDPVTQDRSLKDSGKLYREVIATNGGVL